MKSADTLASHEQREINLKQKIRKIVHPCQQCVSHAQHFIYLRPFANEMLKIKVEF